MMWGQARASRGHGCWHPHDRWSPCLSYIRPRPILTDYPANSALCRGPGRGPGRPDSDRSHTEVSIQPRRRVIVQACRRALAGLTVGRLLVWLGRTAWARWLDRADGRGLMVARCRLTAVARLTAALALELMEMVDTSGLRGGRRPCEQQLLRMAKRRLAILRHAEEITGNANRPPVTFYPKDCAGPPARCFAPSTQLQASARRPPCRARSVSTRGCSGARSVASWRGASTSSSGCWSPAGSGDRRPPRVRWRPMRGRFRRRVAGTHPDLRPPGHTEFHMAGRGGARTRQSSSEADSHHRGRKTHPSGRWSVRASGGYSPRHRDVGLPNAGHNLQEDAPPGGGRSNRVGRPGRLDDGAVQPVADLVGQGHRDVPEARGGQPGPVLADGQGPTPTWGTPDASARAGSIFATQAPTGNLPLQEGH
jgi:hypothetical protein